MPQYNQIIFCFSRRFPKMAELGVVLPPKAVDEDFRWWSSSMGPVRAPSFLVSTRSHVIQPSVPVTETWVSLETLFADWFLGWRLIVSLWKPPESKLHWLEEKNTVFFLWESECSSDLRHSGCEGQASVSGSSVASRSTVGTPYPG